VQFAVRGLKAKPSGHREIIPEVLLSLLLHEM